MTTALHFGILLVLQAASIIDAQKITELKSLRQKFENYVAVIPLCDATKPVIVKFEWAMYSLIRVDDLLEIMDVSSWYRMFWYDCSLAWNATQYNETTESEFPNGKKVWTPDVTWMQRIPYVDAFEFNDGLFTGARTMVTNDGYVSTSRELLMRSYCPMSMWFFPFDTQNCNMSFIAWSYPVEFLVFENTTTGDFVGDLSHSDTWHIEEIVVFSENSSGALDGATFSVLTYQIVMTREPLFYLFYLMLPYFAISLLNCFVFLIPPEAQEKIGFSLSVLLSLSVYMMLMCNITPPKAEIPLLSAYFFSVFVLSIVSTGITVLIEVVHAHHSLYPPPKGLAAFLTNGFLSKWKFFRRGEDISGHSATSHYTGHGTAQSATKSDQSRTKAASSQNQQASSDSKQRSERDHVCEWRQIAYAIDRLMFILYSLVSFLVFAILVTVALRLQFLGLT